MVNSKVSCMRHHFVLDISIYFPFQRELFHSLVQKIRAHVLDMPTHIKNLELVVQIY